MDKLARGDGILDTLLNADKNIMNSYKAGEKFRPSNHHIVRLTLSTVCHTDENIMEIPNSKEKKIIMKERRHDLKNVDWCVAEQEQFPNNGSSKQAGAGEETRGRPPPPRPTLTPRHPSAWETLNGLAVADDR